MRRVTRFSIICAIEAGRLEAQTLLMLTTLKRFGGPLADAPTVAFQGRAGEKVSATTQQRLADLGVDYVYQPDLNRAPWFNYTNKIAAVQFAETHFDTPWRIWMDSDILVLDPPGFTSGEGLEDSDFHARFEFLSPGRTEDSDRFDVYWRAVCDLSELDYDQIPFHDLDLPPKRMKPYFNSGFFLWRAGTGFAETYAQNFYRLLDAKIAPKDIGPWFADQVSLTPTVTTLDLRWQMLPSQDHLMMFANVLQNPDFLEAVARANLVHYSKSRQPPHRAILDPLLLARRPELAGILQDHDAYEAVGGKGVVSLAYKYPRRLRQKLFARACKAL